MKTFITLICLIFNLSLFASTYSISGNMINCEKYAESGMIIDKHTFDIGEDGICPEEKSEAEKHCEEGFEAYSCADTEGWTYY